MRTIRLLITLVAMTAAFLALAAPSFAHSGHRGDRNHDRLPDRWERKHHLSLRFNQANKDQDRDGLRNRAEFLAGTSPRDDDSDNDGTEDGAEGAGRVVSFTDGILVLRLFTTDEVRGLVDARTEIECESQPPVTTASVTTARAANDDGDAEDRDDRDVQNRDDGDVSNRDDAEDDAEDDGLPGCDATALTVGTVVQEAELKTTATGLRYTEIELIR
jgi:hypothetical protein